MPPMPRRCPRCGRPTNVLVGGAGAMCVDCYERQRDDLPIVRTITEGGTEDPEREEQAS